MKIAAGPVHSVALLDNGTLRSWGDNLADQLGIPYVPMSLKPVLISH